MSWSWLAAGRTDTHGCWLRPFFRFLFWTVSRAMPAASPQRGTLFVQDHATLAGDLQAIAMMIMLDHHLARAGKKLGAADITDIAIPLRCRRLHAVCARNRSRWCAIASGAVSWRRHQLLNSLLDRPRSCGRCSARGRLKPYGSAEGSPGKSEMQLQIIRKTGLFFRWIPHPAARQRLPIGPWSNCDRRPGCPITGIVRPRLVPRCLLVCPWQRE